jgi:AAA ATPase-like protein
MRLKKVLIQNYRSIVDSSEVEIDDGVTVVIGKNEQGKSTFLNAIKAFNTTEHFTPRDLPNHLRPELDDRAQAEIPIVTLWFSLEPRDHQKLATPCHNIAQATGIKAVKHYGNNYTFSIINADGTEGPIQQAPRDLTIVRAQIMQFASDLKTKLHAHTERLATFAPNKDTIDQITGALSEAKLTDPADADDLIRTFSTAIKSLTGQDQLILDDIATATTQLDSLKATIQAEPRTDQTTVVQDALPSFVLHSTKSDSIPNDVTIADFVASPDATSKGMANLCRAAGLSIPKIRELAATNEAPQREAYEDHYKGTISGGLNEFWTQAAYTVHFRIEKERLSVSISDGTYPQRIPPSDRSEGFQWYLSFYATLLNDTVTTNHTILLLDNPGLELHLDGQRDIKRFLEEKIAPASQVLYVTHSPAMIDPFNLRQVRAVELLPNLGTKIRNFINKTATDADLLEPVRAAVGMSLVSSLVLNEWNILIEGAADKPIVEGIFVRHYQEHQRNVLVNGSLSESKDAFLARFYQRTGLPYAILLDADSGGRDLEKELLTNGIPQDRIVKLTDVFTDQKNDFATEDILSPAFYHQAVREAYPHHPVDQPAAADRMRARQYEEAFRAAHHPGFSKKRVADTVKKLLSEKKEDEETQANLGRLSTALINCLKAQVPAPARPAEEIAAEHA